MFFAVASKDGKQINQHFGHAERFLIYDVDGADVRLVNEKKVEPYCSYESDHSLRVTQLKAIAAAVGDCRAVVCAQIGQAPQLEMERLGLDVFVADGAITPTLVELAKIL